MADEMTDLQKRAAELKISLNGEETQSEIVALIAAVEQMQPDEPKMIAVVATKVGALPTSGIVPEGAPFSILPEQYSAEWMKPANLSAAKMVKAELARREAAKKKPGAE